MIRFSTRQRAGLGETLRELANFAAAALVFGQFVGQAPVSVPLIVAGIAMWVALVLFALLVDGE
jgi:hypothetical protein